MQNVQNNHQLQEITTLDIFFYLWGGGKSTLHCMLSKNLKI